MTNGFPNLFIPGPFQAGATGNQSFTLDVMAGHVAEIVRQAQEHSRCYPNGHEDASSKGGSVVIEPTREAEEAWSNEIAKRSLSFAGIAGCTPGYLNGEGAMAIAMARMPPEVMAKSMSKAARHLIWGEGIVSFMDVLEKWERNGKLEGLDVRVV